MLFAFTSFHTHTCIHSYAHTHSTIHYIYNLNLYLYHLHLSSQLKYILQLQLHLTPWLASIQVYTKYYKVNSNKETWVLKINLAKFLIHDIHCHTKYHHAFGRCRILALTDHLQVVQTQYTLRTR